MKIKLSAGNHDLISLPVFLTTKSISYNSFYLTGEGKKIPVQFCGINSNLEHIYVFVIDYLKKGKSYTFDIASPGDFNPCNSPTTKSIVKDDEVKLYINSEYFTSYCMHTDIPKPYLGPFCTEDGEYITRHNYTGKEHPHHRNLWFSHGSVNGTDTWNENKNHGYIANNKISSVKNGTVMTSFAAENTWTHNDVTPILDDITEIATYDTGSFTKIIDISLTLKAAYGDVMLDRTKEAGPIAVRMSDDVIVSNGGTIKNYYGAVNESEIWMKRAGFNDYYGRFKSGDVYGVALFDNPSNEGYPAYWHTRDYGLMAVNNFYKGGARLIEKGAVMRCKFRAIIHKGDTDEAQIGTMFNNYITAPVIEILDLT